MALPKPATRIRKRKPQTSRLALEPLEDRTLPSTVLGAQPIHFSADSIQRLEAFLSANFIAARDVQGVTKAELDFFGNLQSPASAADQGLLDSILTKLHTIQSLEAPNGQVSLAFGVGLRADIDAFGADNPDLDAQLTRQLAGFTAPSVAFSLASAIETAQGAALAADGTAAPPRMPFLFLVDMVRAARDIANGSFTGFDSLRVDSAIQSAGEVDTFQFTAPSDGNLLVRLVPQSLKGPDGKDIEGQLALLDDLGNPIPEPADSGGSQLAIPVFAGQSYFLQASLPGNTGPYTLFCAEVFGAPSLDSISGLIAPRPETAATPAIQLAAASSPGVPFDPAAPLAPHPVGTTPPDGGGDAEENPPGGDPNPIPPERQTPPSLAPGGLDELLERYRPKVSQRSTDGPLRNEPTQLQPFMEPDAVDQPGLDPGIELSDSPTPLAQSAHVPHSPASEADAPVADRSVVDSAFIALSNPPATEEADLDPFAHASSACVTIGESPDFVAVVSSVAVALLAQGGLLLALHRPESEHLNWRSPRAHAMLVGV